MDKPAGYWTRVFDEAVILMGVHKWDAETAYRQAKLEVDKTMSQIEMPLDKVEEKLKLS